MGDRTTRKHAARKRVKAGVPLRVVFETVLWGRLCGKGPKVATHRSIAAALRFIDQIEPGLQFTMRHGEAWFYAEDGSALAHIESRLEPSSPYCERQHD